MTFFWGWFEGRGGNWGAPWGVSGRHWVRGEWGGAMWSEGEAWWLMLSLCGQKPHKERYFSVILRGRWWGRWGGSYGGREGSHGGEGGVRGVRGVCDWHILKTSIYIYMGHSFWTGDPMPPKIGLVLEKRGSGKMKPWKLYSLSLSGRFWKFKMADRLAVIIHGRHLKKEVFRLEKWRNNKKTIRIEPQTHVFWSTEHESDSIFVPSPKRLSLT